MEEPSAVDRKFIYVVFRAVILHERPLYSNYLPAVWNDMDVHGRFPHNCLSGDAAWPFFFVERHVSDFMWQPFL